MSHFDPLSVALHPRYRDQVEAERCPDCGHPGRLIAELSPFQIWACPDCEPEVFD